MICTVKMKLLSELGMQIHVHVAQTLGNKIGPHNYLAYVQQVVYDLPR